MDAEPRPRFGVRRCSAAFERTFYWHVVITNAVNELLVFLTLRVEVEELRQTHILEISVIPITAHIAEAAGKMRFGLIQVLRRLFGHFRRSVRALSGLEMIPLLPGSFLPDEASPLFR